MSTRTLANYEGRGLTPIKRNARSISYRLTEVRELLSERNPQWGPEQVEYELNRILANLISHEKVTRLSRCKDQLEFPLRAVLLWL